MSLKKVGKEVANMPVDMTLNSAAATADIAQEELPSYSGFDSSNRNDSFTIERNQRIERYLPLVNRVLTKIRRNLPTHVDLDDLHSAGVTGLIAAIERFDPTQSDTFEGYACIRIRGAILDELRRFDPSTRSSHVRSRKIEAAVRDAEQELGRAPTDKELSARLGISVAELQHWRERGAPVRLMSLDAESDTDGSSGSSLHDVMADDNQTCVRDTMERAELVQLLMSRIEELPDVQKRILAFYYFEGMHFAEIAAVFGLTPARICQIHKQAVTKLHQQIRLAAQR